MPCKHSIHEIKLIKASWCLLCWPHLPLTLYWKVKSLQCWEGKLQQIMSYKHLLDKSGNKKLPFNTEKSSAKLCLSGAAVSHYWLYRYRCVFISNSNLNVSIATNAIHLERNVKVFINFQCNTCNSCCNQVVLHKEN